MSFLTSEKIANALVGFNAIFNEALDSFRKVETLWDRLCMEIPSTGKVEQYNWLGTVPTFTEWTGERNISKLRADSFTITNKKWANGIEVDRDDLDDDKLGMYAPKIRMLAEAAVWHRVNLMVDFFVNGFATTKYGGSYDGLSFFNTAHKDGNGPTWSNKLTATLDDTGALDSAFQKFAEMKDETGEPLNVGQGNQMLLICGPSRMATARALLYAQNLASGASNTNYQRAELIVSGKLTGSDAEKWFLSDLSRIGKPLIHQSRRAPAFRSVTGDDSTQVFMRDKLMFGADARYNCGYAFPQLCVGSDGST